MIDPDGSMKQDHFVSSEPLMISSDTHVVSSVKHMDWVEKRDRFLRISASTAVNVTTSNVPSPLR